MDVPPPTAHTRLRQQELDGKQALNALRSEITGAGSALSSSQQKFAESAPGGVSSSTFPFPPVASGPLKILRLDEPRHAYSSGPAPGHHTSPLSHNGSFQIPAHQPLLPSADALLQAIPLQSSAHQPRHQTPLLQTLAALAQPSPLQSTYQSAADAILRAQNLCNASLQPLLHANSVPVLHTPAGVQGTDPDLGHALVDSAHMPPNKRARTDPTPGKPACSHDSVQRQAATDPPAQLSRQKQHPCKPGDAISPSRSKFRGVTLHRHTKKYEAHLWDPEAARKKPKGSKGRTHGKQVYLGGYDSETEAARAYDRAALVYWKESAQLNFLFSDYEGELSYLYSMTREEAVASLRRASSGFSRGLSKYRGVTKHHQQGRWESRIGRVKGDNYMYLGTFSSEKHAAIAYDHAALKHSQKKVITNFAEHRYYDAQGRLLELKTLLNHADTFPDEEPTSATATATAIAIATTNKPAAAPTKTTATTATAAAASRPRTAATRVQPQRAATRQHVVATGADSAEMLTDDTSSVDPAASSHSVRFGSDGSWHPHDTSPPSSSAESTRVHAPLHHMHRGMLMTNAVHHGQDVSQFLLLGSTPPPMAGCMLHTRSSSTVGGALAQAQGSTDRPPLAGSNSALHMMRHDWRNRSSGGWVSFGTELGFIGQNDTPRVTADDYLDKMLLDSTGHDDMLHGVSHPLLGLEEGVLPDVMAFPGVSMAGTGLIKDPLAIQPLVTQPLQGDQGRLPAARHSGAGAYHGHLYAMDHDMPDYSSLGQAFDYE